MLILDLVQRYRYKKAGNMSKLIFKIVPLHQHQERLKARQPTYRSTMAQRCMAPPCQG